MGNTPSAVKGSQRIHSNRKKSDDATCSVTSSVSSQQKQSKNAFLVERDFCEAFNRRDTEPLRKLASSNCLCQYKGAENALPLSQMLDAVNGVFASFPDSQSRWESVKEVKRNKVVIKGLYSFGTHTGKPFGFGPFKPIPATGKFVKEDPADIILTMSGGKITHLEIDMENVKNAVTGPPGYYMSIGGKLA